jgi:hypothetical protein
MIAAVFLVVLAARGAHADAIEEYIGSRPAEATAIMSKLGAIMRKHGKGLGPVAFDRDVVHWARVPAIADPSATPVTISEDLELGKKRWIRGAFSDAVRLLTVALRTAEDNGPMTVQIQNLEELRVSAMIALALSSANTGDALKAAAVMEDELRTYPDHVIVRGKDPVDAEQLWTQTRSIAMRAARGHLRIEVPDAPHARIYVNEVSRSSDGAYDGDLLPGTYRALIVAGSTAYRFDVDVQSAHTVVVSIDLDLQPVLTISGQWAGLLLSDRTRRNELRDLQGVSRMLGGLTEIGVVGLLKEHDRWYLTGKVYDANKNAIVRSGRVPLGGADEDRRMDELADFIDDGAPSPDIEPVVDVAIEPVTAPTPESTTTTTTLWPAWTAAGTGVGFVAAGVYLLHLDGMGTCGATPPVQCPQRWNNATIGWTTIGFSAVAVGFAAYWYLHERGREPATSVALAPTRGGAVASFGWSF